VPGEGRRLSVHLEGRRCAWRREEVVGAPRREEVCLAKGARSFTRRMCWMPLLKSTREKNTRFLVWLATSLENGVT
jgi:hypothetical protein